MNRRNRTLIVVALAVALASIASFGVYRAIESIPVREIAIPKTFAVVASKPVPVGTMLAVDDLKVIGWPTDSQVPGGFSKPEEIVGRGLIESVAQNEPITESKLAPREAGAGLPPTIPPGMRAMAVRVNDVVSVAGFTVPGTHVDVIVTARTGNGQDQSSMSRAVLSNIQVLTAGTRMEQQKKDNQPIATTVVTLLVTPQDAEKLALAGNDGTVILALRNPLDTDETKTTGERMANLMSSPDPAPVRRVVEGKPKMVVPPPPPPPPTYTIEAIRGAKKSEEIIK